MTQTETVTASFYYSTSTPLILAAIVRSVSPSTGSPAHPEPNETSADFGILLSTKGASLPRYG